MPDARSVRRASAADAEKSSESRLSGFFSLTKHRSSMKATPTSPIATTTTVSVATTDTDAPPPVMPIVTPEPVVPEVKGHVQEGVKRGSPLTGRHVGVHVMGNDLLAEMRAKQEKRLKVRFMRTVLNAAIKFRLIHIDLI